MNDLIFARMLHVVGVIWWLGGVAMVTTVLLPMAQRRSDPKEGFKLFEEVESYFVVQARVAVILVGLTGFYMAWKLNLWMRFTLIEFWWMHLMVVIWGIYVVMLFVLEPIMDKKICHAVHHHGLNPIPRMIWVHRVLLFLSLVAAAAAVGGPHGMYI